MKHLQRLLVCSLLLAWTAAAVAQGPVNKEFTRTSPRIVQAFRPVVAKASLSSVRVVADGKDVLLTFHR